MDANTYFINRHLAEIDDYEAQQRAKWPICEECAEPTDPDFMCENDLCEWCNAPSPAEVARMKATYDGEKAAGLHRPQSEINTDLVAAGRGHLVRK